jgi:hypothetical protein
VLNLFWAPPLECVDYFTYGAALAWTNNIDVVYTALLSEMIGIVMSADNPFYMDMLI